MARGNRTAIVEAGKKAHWKTVLGLKDKVGVTRFLRRFIDEVDVPERVRVDGIQLREQLRGIDRVAVMQSQRRGDDTAREPVVSSGADGADTKLGHHDLDNTVLDI